MTSMRGIVLLALVSGGCVYQPGSFVHGPRLFPRERATIGCLDIAIERRADRDGWPVMAYRFGNRCDRPTMVDLSGLAVMGRDATGAEYRLVPFDPKQEIRPLEIDARLAGGEVIAYATEVELAQICVDAASLARATPARWMCFANPEVPSQDVPEDALPPSEGVSPDEAASTTASLEVTP